MMFDGAPAEAVALLQRLVACDSSNPPGNETQAIAILEEFFAHTTVACERVAKEDGRANLVARIPGVEGGPSLAFLTHLDVVQARREDWAVEPFAGTMMDGAVWGRGTIDMKSQVAAVSVALRRLALEGFQPPGDIMLLALADEEVGDAGVGAPWLVEERPDLRPDFIVGEGAGERYVTSRGPIYLFDHGVKCTATATVTVRGRALDASLPTTATNACFPLARLLSRLEQHRSPIRILPEVRPLLRHLAPAATTDDELVEHARAAGPALAPVINALVGTVIQPATIEVRGPKNVVPEKAELQLQCLALPGTSRDDLERELRLALGKGPYQLEVSEPQGGLTSPLETPLHQAIAETLAAVDHEATLIPALGYGFSDCHVFRDAYGSVAYGFIPFRHADPTVNLTTKHAPDERVLVDDLVFQTEVALQIARRLGRLAS
jgi:acetylornithine deacetylase/succinyl-diaminopimelate desuccinylase-like protein